MRKRHQIGVERNRRRKQKRVVMKKNSPLLSRARPPSPHFLFLVATPTHLPPRTAMFPSSSSPPPSLPLPLTPRTTMPSSSPPPQSRDNLISARRLFRIPGTGELIAAPFPQASMKTATKKKKTGGSSGSSSSDWESTSTAAAKSTTSNTFSPSGPKKLVAYSVNAPRNLTPARRPGKSESAKKQAKGEAARAEDAAAAAVATCTLRPFLTTSRAFAIAAERASAISAAAPTNGGVLSEAAKVARRAAGF